MTYVPASDRYDRMIYRRSGRSGLQLPTLSLGLWNNFGHDHPLPFWNLEDDWTDQSDQGAFIDADIPAIYIGVDSTKDYHRPTDTFDRIDQKFLVNAAELVARLVQRLDHAEELPD